MTIEKIIKSGEISQHTGICFEVINDDNSINYLLTTPFLYSTQENIRILFNQYEIIETDGFEFDVLIGLVLNFKVKKII